MSELLGMDALHEGYQEEVQELQGGREVPGDKYGRYHEAVTGTERRGSAIDGTEEGGK